MSIAPREDVGGADLGGAVANFPAWAVARTLGGFFGGGKDPLSSADARVLRDAGYQVVPASRGTQWIGPAGVIGLRAAVDLARTLRTGPGTPPIAPEPNAPAPAPSQAESLPGYLASLFSWYGLRPRAKKKKSKKRRAFVGPVPVLVPTPDIATPAANAVPVLARVLLRALPLLALFWPSRTASDDVWQPAPAPPKRTRTPRPRVTAPTLPDRDRWRAYVGPHPFPLPTPRTQPRPVPGPASNPRPAPIPGTVLQPLPAPNVGPIRVPAPAPLPSPTPTPTRVPTWLPFLPLLSPPSSTPQFRRFDDPLTGDSNPPAESPLNAPFPNKADRCTEQQTKPDRRKRSCTNPVVRKRKFTKGNRQFEIITRELLCPVSSRRKPRSQRAPRTTISSAARLLSTHVLRASFR